MKKSWMSTTVIAVCLSLQAISSWGQGQNSVRPEASPANVEAGRIVYMDSCVWCHGLSGRGDGPVAYFQSRNRAPRPRDFTSGVYKYRTTVTGAEPLVEDLFRTITKGIPGYMPSFVSLTARERWQVIYYIKSFASEAWQGEPEQIPIGEPLPSTSASIRRGETMYQAFQCWECHGFSGRGDGPAAGEHKDDWGFLILPNDLTKPASFHNGQRKEDIYRTFMTGLNGTPMPSYKDSLPEMADAWHLVNFILSLSAKE